MILRVFSVFDSKANAYLAPFFFAFVGEAVRAFIDTARSPKSKFFTNGQDFTLFQLGHYDDSNATFDLLTAPESIGRADIMRRQHETMLSMQNDLHEVHTTAEDIDNAEIRETSERDGP